MNLLAIGLGALAIGRIIADHEDARTRAQRYRETIINAAAEYDLSPEILFGVLRVESNFNPNAVGSAGEIGMSQFKQIALDDIVTNAGFTRAYDVKELHDPTKAIYAAAALLALNRKRSGSMYTSIRAYNVGIGAALKDAAAGANYLTDVLRHASTESVYALFSGGDNARA